MQQIYKAWTNSCDSGNYDIGDQITALQWTINSIANFGGDPNIITINGESAGAGSLRTLLGSPKAIGMFSRRHSHVQPWWSGEMAITVQLTLPITPSTSLLWLPASRFPKRLVATRLLWL
jgi:hypothetical protein